MGPFLLKKANLWHSFLPCICCGGNTAAVNEYSFRLHWHWSIVLFNFLLNELHCNLWALAVGLTCCFLMQRLTDDGAAQKLPPSGLNTETAQGDALPTVMLLSPSCFALCAPSKEHSNIFPCLSPSFCLYLIISVLLSAPCCTVVVWIKKCVNPAMGSVFHRLSVT